ncbi:MAG: DUF5916 domain-containing protein [Bacteroidota bacterium]
MKTPFLTLFCCFTFLISLSAQDSESLFFGKKTYVTQRLQSAAPTLDGQFDEACWKQVQWGGTFIQQEPVDSARASQRTAFKILYDDRNLYVAFRCYDTDPDQIVKRMSRRDNFEGDWVEINIDSYHDLRTAFSFTITAAGVKGDEFISNNGNNWDSNWNPIWYVKTAVDEEGWTAEVRIPFSQLRFGDKEEHVWGLQFTRRDFRKDERSIWQHIPRTAGVWVSQFGELHGLIGIKPQKQIEIQPYLLAQAETFEKEENNPFATGSDSRIDVGLDGKVAVTSDLILDFTINPDFGQVDADPAAVRLDGFQNFFGERRPFFIESRNIFDYTVTGSGAGGPYDNDVLFYSRRIGGAPHGSVDLASGEYAEEPTNTSILGAAKFSGKTKKGLSIGILESVTAREKAIIDHEGDRRSEIVEPLTSYFVGRLQQDYDGGNRVIGGMFTAVNRQLQETEMDDLHRSAYSGGIDFIQFWDNQSWYVSAKGIFSAVHGSKNAIYETQTAFEHAFHRPDAEHLSVDTNATTLAGHGGTLKVGKRGGNWKFDTGLTWRSPGLELNDIGFMNNADDITHFFWGGYRINQPFSIFRNFSVNYNHWTSWDFGGNNLYQAVNTNGHAQFKNFWGMGTGMTYEHLNISNNALFGGPALRRPRSIGNFLYFYSDSRKAVTLNFNTYHSWGFENTVRVRNYNFWLRAQPSDAFNFSIGPGYNHFHRPIQNVDEQDYEGQTRYIAATVDQKTINAQIRLNYAITPNLTIQYYGQPFVTRVRYKDFKYITNSLAENHVDRFQPYEGGQLNKVYIEEDEDWAYQIDENKDKEVDYTFGDPDFTYFQFRSNLVARWEYIPGSEIFLVWSQGRTENDDPTKNLFRSLNDNLFSSNAENIFLVKFTYRFLL